MTKRSDERLQFFSDLLLTGLSYHWFKVAELDLEEVTAVIYTDEEDEGTFTKRHEVGPDDIARGLKLYRQMLEGTHEEFPGQWEMADNNSYCRPKGKAASPDCYGWQLVEADKSNGEEGDYDANTADEVMQFAILGHSIYS